VSYSHRNVRWTRNLVAAFEDAGIPYWFDTKIRPSRVWRDELLEAIDGAACVVVVVTPDAADSEWVQREVTYALDRAKPVIPITRDETVLDQLAHIQHVAVTSTGRLPDALLGTLYECCGSSTIRVYTNEQVGITFAAADDLTDRMSELGMATMVRPHGQRDLAPDALFIHAGTTPQVLRTVLEWLPYDATFLYPPDYERGSLPDLPGLDDDAWGRPASISCGLCSALDRMRRDAPPPWATATPVSREQLSRIAEATDVQELNERLRAAFSPPR
jgi:hypothetical protein